MIGSRYVAGGGVNYPFYRKFLSQIANLWARFFLNLPVRDSTAGFKCFRRKIFKNFNLENFVSSGYIFNVETVYYAHKLGFKIKEVPIIFEDREKGKTKMSVGEILQGFVGLFRIKRNNLNPVC